MRELRIHGVGGPQEERLLGVTNPDDLDVVSLGVGTRIVKRRGASDGVEGYSWGGLTSSSRYAASWVLYLPFSLINGAGWAAPRNWTTRIHSFLIHLLALTATASVVTWIGYLLVDLVGSQWRNRLLTLSSVRTRPWLNGAIEYALPIACGAIFIALVIVMFALMNKRSPTEKLEQDSGGWKSRETFAPAFYRHRSRERFLWVLHLAVAAAGVIVVLGVAIDRHGSLRQLWLGELVVDVGMAQGVIVGLLWLAAAVSWSRPFGAAIATLGAVTVNASFAGLALLATKFLSGFPDGATGGVFGGPELGAVGAFVWALAIGVIAMALSALHFYAKPLDDCDLDPTVPMDINAAVTGITTPVRGKVVRTRRLARLAHCAPMPVCFLSFAFVVAGAVYLGVCIAGWYWPFDHRQSYDSTDWIDWIGGVVLTALPLALALAFRRAATSVKNRRTLGVIWDVLLIWPRRYHPLAVPPYAADATGELGQRIRLHTESDTLLVSAHSQGSALAFITIQSLAADAVCPLDLKRVTLLTYGSHVNGLYALLFPCHFHDVSIAAMLNTVAEWRNFWRRTDPIGGPIALANRRPYLGELIPGDDALPDRICSDPPHDQTAAWTDLASALAPLERDRPPWLELSIHSHYLAEPLLKDWVNIAKFGGSPTAT